MGALLTLQRGRKATLCRRQCFANAQHGLHRRDKAGIKLQPTPSPEETTIDIPTVPVKLDGETLFRVRRVWAYPAEQRVGNGMRSESKDVRRGAAI